MKQMLLGRQQCSVVQQPVAIRVRSSRASARSIGLNSSSRKRHSNIWAATVAGQQHLQQVLVLLVFLTSGCSHCHLEQLPDSNTVCGPRQLPQLCSQILFPDTVAEDQPD